MDEETKLNCSNEEGSFVSLVEQLVREACNNEPWGASRSLMNRISEQTSSDIERNIVFKTVWEILSISPPKWRSIFKSLSLLEFLCNNGHPLCVDETYQGIALIISLQNFTVTENSVEKGAPIREKSKSLVELLKDKAS